MILTPIWMALQLLILVMGSTFVVALMARAIRGVPMVDALGLIVWSTIVFSMTLLCWLLWTLVDGPVFAVVEIGGSPWPLGILAIFSVTIAIATGALAHRLGLKAGPAQRKPATPRERVRPRSEPPPRLA